MWPKENRGLKSPRLFISTSSRRFWVVSFELWAMSSEQWVSSELQFNSPKRWRSCWTRFSISQRALTYPLPSVRSWNKFRMTLGRFLFFYSHFSEANSILLSKTTHNSNRLKDGMPKANSRGFLNPWRKDISLKSVWKTGNVKRVRGHESPTVFNSASLQTPLLCGQKKTEGLKAPGYSYPRLPDVFE